MPTSCYLGHPLQSPPPIPMLRMCPIQAKSKPAAGLIEALYASVRLGPGDAQSHKQSMTRPRPTKDFILNDIHTATAVAAASPREDDEAVRSAAKTWKPSPCLLTRRELQALIAEQLG
ncbi:MULTISPECIES: hypothetical protein [Rhizobium]|jgi:hypothetical protein|uniref:hypothetical protein n=1 Tax=Rhizobium TaxID=379 RepID=UPI0007BE87D9|nr:hypothetical protein [Rhizobium anhuiense]KZS50467.1 hypothetical protein AS890_23815 [Rhizobium anhuiense bv. trifolii]